MPNVADRLEQPTWDVVRKFPNPSLSAEWRAFLGAQDAASHFASPEFFQEPRGGRLRPFAIVCRQNGAIALILTGTEGLGSLVSGAPHRPQYLFAEGIEPGAADLLMAQAIASVARRKWVTTVYSWQPSDALQRLGFRQTQVQGTLVLHLDQPEDAIFSGFSETKRNYLRQSEKRGLTVGVGLGAGEEVQLQTLFAETDTRHGVVPRDRPFLAAALRGEDPCRQLFLARKDGLLVAATVIRYIRGGLAEYSENASLKSSWACRPNDALLWQAIRWSRQAGCRQFSFGGSTPFKAGFGGRLLPVFRLRRDATPFSLLDRSEWAKSKARALRERLRGGAAGRPVADSATQ